MPSNTLEPDLREILGALILGSDRPVTPREVRRVIEQVAEERRPEDGDAPAVSDAELLAADKASNGDETAAEDETLAGSTGVNGMAIRSAFEELREALLTAGLGIEVVEVSGGYRMQTSPHCGPWVRRMLNRGKPQRISRPMIETLAIIAYRQPIARSEIESIRGVGVGHVVKALMEAQLVRIIGRSELPGRPFLFGTTNTFLEHFGLKNLNELNAMQPGVERTPPAEQRSKHIKRKADTAADSDAEPASDEAPTISVDIP